MHGRESVFFSVQISRFIFSTDAIRMNSNWCTRKCSYCYTRSYHSHRGSRLILMLVNLAALNGSVGSFRLIITLFLPSRFVSWLAKMVVMELIILSVFVY
jgi:hypothetical protein